MRSGHVACCAVVHPERTLHGLRQGRALWLRHRHQRLPRDGQRPRGLRQRRRGSRRRLACRPCQEGRQVHRPGRHEVQHRARLPEDDCRCPGRRHDPLLLLGPRLTRARARRPQRRGRRQERELPAVGLHDKRSGNQGAYCRRRDLRLAAEGGSEGHQRRLCRQLLPLRLHEPQHPQRRRALSQRRFRRHHRRRARFPATRDRQAHRERPEACHLHRRHGRRQADARGEDRRQVAWGIELVDGTRARGPRRPRRQRRGRPVRAHRLHRAGRRQLGRKPADAAGGAAPAGARGALPGRSQRGFQIHRCLSRDRDDRHPARSGTGSAQGRSRGRRGSARRRHRLLGGCRRQGRCRSHLVPGRGQGRAPNSAARWRAASTRLPSSRSLPNSRH